MGAAVIVVGTTLMLPSALRQGSRVGDRNSLGSASSVVPGY
jgi:hypothetical protein